MKLTILETSDIHSYIYPTNYVDGDEKPYGLLKLASAIKAERAKANGEIILIDNGDFIQGSPLGHYTNQHLSQPRILLTGLNQLDYDAGVLGNHEFIFGESYAKQCMAAVKFPILSANVLDDQGNTFADKPYQLLEKDGIKIAILGLTTQYVKKFEIEENIAGLHFHSAVTTAKQWLPKLTQIADIIVVAYHGGFERDIKSGQPFDSLTGENEAYQLASECPEIDVLLTGHQHKKIATHIAGIPVVQPAYAGAYLAKVVLDIDDNTKKIITSVPSLIKVDQYKADDSLKHFYAPVQSRVTSWLDRPITQTGPDMQIKNTVDVRLQEHPYVEFINKMQLAITSADISSTSLMSDHQTGFNEVICNRDVMENYGYPNTLAVIEVTGAELKAALEQTASYLKVTSDGSILPYYYGTNAKAQPYLYDMYEGIDYLIDMSQAVGQRIVFLNYKDRPVQSGDRFKLVANNFRLHGGQYKMFAGKPFLAEWHEPISEQMMTYLATKNYWEAVVNNNFRVIRSDEK